MARLVGRFGAADLALLTVVNYLAWVLGAGAGLAAAGVDYRLARIVAGACEAVYMYAAMRWLVFATSSGTEPPGDAAEWP